MRKEAPLLRNPLAIYKTQFDFFTFVTKVGTKKKKFFDYFVGFSTKIVLNWLFSKIGTLS